MPRRPRTATGGLVYHVLNRGVARMDLFDDEGDYAAFERVLAEALAREPGVRLLGYCLMPNHWHLVVWPRRDGELSEFMRWLTVTHTQRRHAHRHTSGTGPVYQGRYKSFPIQRDEHLITVLRYVERNALRAGLVGSGSARSGGSGSSGGGGRAGGWRWGSLWRWENRNRAAGRDPGLPAISDWPIDRPRNWKRTVNTPLNEAEAGALRRCMKRGSPYGDDRWTGRTAARLGLESSLRPIGRPRRGAGGVKA